MEKVRILHRFLACWLYLIINSMPLPTNKQFEEDNDLNPAPDSLFYWIALPFMVVITIGLLFVALTR